MKTYFLRFVVCVLSFSVLVGTVLPVQVVSAQRANSSASATQTSDQTENRSSSTAENTQTSPERGVAEPATNEPVVGESVPTDTGTDPASSDATDPQAVDPNEADPNATEPDAAEEDIQPLGAESQVLQQTSGVNQNKNDQWKNLGKPEVSVNQLSGVATYDYPIELPAGRGGLQPKLNLQYSSGVQSNTNLYGYGWDLEMGSIQRRGKTGRDKLYQENEFIINLFSEQQVLKPISVDSNGYGTYGVERENGNFWKIDYFSDNSWILIDKYGTKYKFGSTIASRQYDSASSAKVFKWFLEEVRDSNDNFMRFSYFQDSGQVYPDKINYTGSGIQDGIFEVQFLREQRADIISDRSTQFVVQTKYRISEIQLKIEGKLRRKITLSYSVGTNQVRTLLSSIIETAYDESNNAITIPKTEFTYNSNPKDWEANVWGVPGQQPVPTGIVTFSGIEMGVRFIDVNGDNLVDLVKGYNKLEFGGTSETGVYINNGNSWVLDPSWASPGVFVKGGKDTGMRFADVNADGRIDIIQSYEKFETTATGEPAGIYGGVFMNTGNGWVQDTSWKVPVGIVSSGGGDLGVRILDINGDGLVDIIQSYSFAGNKKKQDVYINDGKQWNKDVNWVYPSQIASSVKTDDGVRFVDINGDGLVDLLSHVVSDKKMADKPGGIVFLNTGKGWVHTQGLTLPVATMFGDGSDVGTRFVDVNGDGLMDVMQGFRPTANTSTESIYLNTANGWLKTNDFGIPGMLADFGGLNVDFIDVNGDGLTDKVSSIDYGTGTVGGVGVQGGVALKKSSVNAGPDDLLVKVKNSSGSSMDIKYQSATLYKDGSGTRSNAKTSITVQTVKEVVQNDGLGNIVNNKYNYEGGEFFVDGTDIYKNRFVGFHKVSLTDSENNVSVNYFHQGGGYNGTALGENADDFYKTGLLYRSEQYDALGKLFTTNINKWDSVDLGNGRSFVKLASSVSQTFDGGSTNKATAVGYTYDNSNGNVLTETNYGEVSAGSDGSFNDIASDKTTLERTYASNASSNLLAFPKTETLKNQSNVKIGEMRYYYDGATSLGAITKGNSTKTEKWLDTNNSYLATGYEYTPEGLLFSTTNSRGYKTSLVYDSKKLYPTQVSNVKGQTVKFEYNLYTGEFTKQTDPNGIIAVKEYDSFNRPYREKVSSTSNKNQLNLVKEYAYRDTIMPRSVEMREFQDGGGYRNVVHYFDGLGRTVQERELSETANKYIVKNLTYDKRGNLYKEYLPYFESGVGYSGLSQNVGSNTVTYDVLARPVKVANLLGQTSFQISPWQVKSTDANGKKKAFYYDAQKNLVRVDEVNGAETYATYYTYSPTGLLKQIKDAKSNVRNFNYDSLGQLTSQEDLHAVGDSTFAVWNYQYDQNGNLTQLVKPAGEVVKYAYDELDRIVTEDFTGLAGVEVTYEYDNTLNGIGRISKIKKGNFENEFLYDNRGNVATDSKTIDGVSYTASFSYDLQNRIVQGYLPDSSIVKTTYNLGGQVEKVQKRETGSSQFVDVIKNYDYTPMKQMARIDYGNGAVAINTYDPAKLYRLTKKVSSVGSTRVQNISYTYDAVGNVTKVVDASVGVMSDKKIMPKGDVNGDESVNLLDSGCVALTVLWYGQGKNPDLLPKCVGRAGYLNADLDCNSKIDGNDAYIVNMLAFGKALPVSSDTDQDGIVNSCEPLDPIIKKVNTSTAKVADYTYDDLYRLVSAKITNAGAGTNYIHAYKYDALGNMTYNTAVGDMTYGQTAESPFANPHALTKVTSGPLTGKALVYNKNGAVVSDGLQTMEWDYNDKLLAATQNAVKTTFEYDHTGQRIKKNNDKYVWDNYQVEESGKIVKHIAEVTVEVLNGQAKDYYTLQDNLGSSSVMLDGAGAISQIIDYYPYGATRLEKQYGGFDEKNKFTGHELDDESGLYYANARYYSPEVGRFYSLDPASLGSPLKFLQDPQQLNFYAYARNNPLKFVDPSGNEAEAPSFWKRSWGYVNGVWNSAVDTVTSVTQAVIHPVDTVSNAYNQFKDNADYLVNYAQTHTGEQFVSDLQQGVSITVSNAVENFNNLSEFEKGEKIGDVFGAIKQAVIGGVYFKSLKVVDSVPDKVKSLVPKEWGKGHITDDGAGMEWTNPNNSFESIRYSEARPNAPWAGQKVDNVKIRGSDGQYRDINGNTVSKKSEEAHIKVSDL